MQARWVVRLRGLRWTSAVFGVVISVAFAKCCICARCVEMHALKMLMLGQKIDPIFVLLSESAVLLLESVNETFAI